MGKKKKKDDNVITRTLIINHSFSKNERLIIDLMTKTSKNVYNCTVYCFTVFNKYKQDIYRRLYYFLMRQPNIKTLTKEAFEKKLYYFYECAYKKYSFIKNIVDHNNKIIYKYIVDKLNDQKIILDNENYHKFKYETMSELSNNNDIIFTDYGDVFINIINNICDSIYKKNFFEVQYKLYNHVPIEGFSDTFINDVKRGDYLIKYKPKINYKSKIKDIIGTKLLSEQNYISRFTYNHLYENRDILPSDIIVNIMRKAFESIKSYYALKQEGFKCNLPKYLKGDSKFGLFYFKQFIREHDDNIRIIVGKYIAKNYLSITNDNTLVCINNDKPTAYKKYAKLENCKNITRKTTKKENHIFNNKYISKTDESIFDGCYMNIPKPPKLQNKNVQLRAVEIVPIYDGYKYEIHYKYDTIKETRLIEEGKVEDYISIDLGISNLMTIYNPSGEQHIINGGYLVKINNMYNKTIDKLKSEAKKKNDKYMTNQIRRLLIRRANRINNYFNLVVKWLANHYKTKKVIIGYNTNWKKSVNMGKTMNRRFYGIPYSKLIYKLKDKFDALGSEIIVNEESYTSKCDALAFEDIKKKAAYMGKRVKRGLFKSSTGKFINADLNGAINIMRKALNRKGILMKEILGKSILNPKRVDLFKYVHDASASG